MRAYRSFRYYLLLSLSALGIAGFLGCDGGGGNPIAGITGGLLGNGQDGSSNGFALNYFIKPIQDSVVASKDAFDAAQVSLSPSQVLQTASFVSTENSNGNNGGGNREIPRDNSEDINFEKSYFTDDMCNQIYNEFELSKFRDLPAEKINKNEALPLPLWFNRYAGHGDDLGAIGEYTFALMLVFHCYTYVHYQPSEQTPNDHSHDGQDSINISKITAKSGKAVIELTSDGAIAKPVKGYDRFGKKLDDPNSTPVKGYNRNSGIGIAWDETNDKLTAELRFKAYTCDFSGEERLWAIKADGSSDRCQAKPNGRKSEEPSFTNLAQHHFHMTEEKPGGNGNKAIQLVSQFKVIANIDSSSTDSSYCSETITAYQKAEYDASSDTVKIASIAYSKIHEENGSNCYNSSENNFVTTKKVAVEQNQEGSTVYYQCGYQGNIKDTSPISKHAYVMLCQLGEYGATGDSISYESDTKKWFYDATGDVADTDKTTDAGYFAPHQTNFFADADFPDDAASDDYYDSLFNPDSINKDSINPGW